MSMKKTSIKAGLNSLQLSDVYSLLLFVLYKVKDIPDYAVLSELCYLLDNHNLIRLLTYFAGKTITIPSEEDFVILTSALLLYQYVNLDGISLTDALMKLSDLTPKQKDNVTNLYLQIIPIINNYNIDRSQLQKNGR